MKCYHIYNSLSVGSSFTAGFMDDAGLYLRNASATHAGSIHVSSVGLGHAIDVAGSITGNIQVGHIGCVNCNRSGLVHVAGSASTILIYAENSWYGGVSGQVQVGTLLDALDVPFDVHRTGSGPSIAVDNLVGEIRLWRSLLDNLNAPVEVQIGSMGPAAALAVDWDANEPNPN